MGLTTGDYAAITALVVVVGGQIVNIITAFKVKGIEARVDGINSAQAALIASLHDKNTDKDAIIADQKQVAAVLAGKTIKEAADNIPTVVEKLDDIVNNTDATVKAIKGKK